MFKKLQRKILLLNMTLISAVMLLAFATVYITTSQSIQSENQRKMNTQTPSLAMKSEGEALLGETGSVASYTVSSDYVLSFSIEIDDDGSIITINSIIDMPEESLCGGRPHGSRTRQKRRHNNARKQGLDV